MNDMSPWHSYLGREAQSVLRLEPEVLARFDATLGGVGVPVSEGQPLPLGIHWCVGVETVPTGALGPDGHPPKGGFLPPVPQPRRMWAGGALEIYAPLLAGQWLTRRSVVTDIVEKTGKSGALVFVTLTHEIASEGELAIRERQDIVYRPAEPPREQPPLAETTELPEGDGWLLPDTRLLFRYSALTFNSHRIHYDLPYARGQENYPGLVVHGPLQATLLAARAARELGRPLARFGFRGVAPAFAGVPLRLVAGQDEAGGLTVSTQQSDRICMTATAA